MSSVAQTDAGGRGSTSTRSNLEVLRSAYQAFNEMVRTEGDPLVWVREYFDPQAEYRPIEDPDWFRDPHAIARSVARWIETWGVGKYRVNPDEILEFGDDRFVVASHHRGIGRGSGVPIEAVTYIAYVWRDGKIVWFDEHLDREGALAALGERTSQAGELEADGGFAVAERLWKLSEAAFAAFVRSRSDRQLERLFGSGRGLRAIFKRMEQVFEPAKAGGFAGEVQYELVGANEVRKWVVQIDSGRAITRAGEARDPRVTMRMSLPLFIRVATREVHPVKAFREGWMEVKGDFEAAARIAVMFRLSR